MTIHRVGGSSVISPAHVRENLALLKRGHEILSPSEFVATRCDKRFAMVTVDDAHADVYHSVFPVAKSLGVPFTICVPTDFFFRREWLWFNKLEWAWLRARRGKTICIENRRFHAGDQESLSRLKSVLKDMAVDLRTAIIEKTLCCLSVDVPPYPTEEYRPVADGEMREMLASGLVELAGHTVTHPIATKISGRQLRGELAESKYELEEYWGRKVVSFCYPGGDGNFDARTKEAVRSAGYEMAFTCIEGINRPGKMDMFALRRVHVDYRYGVAEKLVSGLGDFQETLRSAVTFRQGTN